MGTLARPARTMGTLARPQEFTSLLAYRFCLCHAKPRAGVPKIQFCARVGVPKIQFCARVGVSKIQFCTRARVPKIRYRKSSRSMPSDLSLLRRVTREIPSMLAALN
jgi:hypothetical protein